MPEKRDYSKSQEEARQEARKAGFSENNKATQAWNKVR
jgi:hypothetical protein